MNIKHMEIIKNTLYFWNVENSHYRWFSDSEENLKNWVVVPAQKICSYKGNIMHVPAYTIGYRCYYDDSL